MSFSINSDAKVLLCELAIADYHISDELHHSNDEMFKY